MGRWSYKVVVAAVFTGGVSMDLLDTTVVNVALPTLGRQFHAPLATVEWVVLGYLLSLAVWVPASGWIGDRFGTKRIYLGALAAFTVASVACGVAPSMGWLIAFRIVQGIGGGMLVPVGSAMLFRAYPPIERARAATVLTIATVIAPALGPVVGGWIVTYHSWRWIFLINVPVGIATFLIGVFGLKEHTEPTAGRFDVPGFLCSGGGLALVLYALSRGPEQGWGSPAVWVPGALGLVLFALLVVVELRVPEPMLDLRLFAERLYRSANIVMGVAYGTLSGVLFVMPLFLQSLLGFTALQSGLTTFPQAIGLILTSHFVGQLYHRVGPRRLILFGILAVTVTTLPLAFVHLDVGLWTLRGIMFSRGIAMAFLVVPLQTCVYANISPSDTGRASALFSAGRQVTASLGVAVLATVLIETTRARTAGAVDPQAGALSAFHLTFLVGALLVAASGLAAFLIRDRDAAGTMRRTVELEPALPD